MKFEIPTRRSVMLVTASLGGGGAEQQALRVANALDHERFAVSVAVFRGGGAYEDRLDPRVTIHALVPRRLVGSSTVTSLEAAVRLWRFFIHTRPDVVVAFHTTAGLVSFLATRSRGVPLIVSVQNTLSHEVNESNFVTRLTTRLAPLVLRRSAAVVALSRGVAQDLSRSWGVAPSDVTVVHNAGFDPGTRAMADESVDLPQPRRPHTLVACGRLAEQKGYDTLLHAFAQVTRTRDCSLWVLGEGPQRARLEALAAELDIRDRVSFLGFRPNPFPYIRSADVFILSSRYEGFANVVAEAMWLGVPVVATDCEHGPREILGEERHGGVLVPVDDHGALAGAVDELLADDCYRRSLGHAAAERASAFSDIASARGYAKVIGDVLRRARTIDG